MTKILLDLEIRNSIIQLSKRYSIVSIVNVALCVVLTLFLSEYHILPYSELTSYVGG